VHRNISWLRQMCVVLLHHRHQFQFDQILHLPAFMRPHSPTRRQIAAEAAAAVIAAPIHRHHIQMWSVFHPPLIYSRTQHSIDTT
jgi:hypothetical protein